MNSYTSFQTSFRIAILLLLFEVYVKWVNLIKEHNALGNESNQSNSNLFLNLIKYSFTLNSKTHLENVRREGKDRRVSFFFLSR